MIQEVLLGLVLISSIPVVWLVAWFCRDELIAGRKWFKLIAIIGGVAGVGFLFFNLAVGFGLLYLGVVGIVNLRMSYSERFMKKK